MEAARPDPRHAGALISCLMVTLPVPRRLAYASAAIEAFRRQTYPRKELVLVVSGGTAAGRRALLDHVQSLGAPDIRAVEIEGDRTLGALRNASLAHARGEVVCQWDDDDLHHPERLRAQSDALLESGRDAVLLQDVMQHFPRDGKLYWTNWRATEAGGHPGTLMARSAAAIAYPTEGQVARLGEDLSVALALRDAGRLGLLAGMPHLFVYVSHDHNSWDAGHHRTLAERLAISTGLLRRREARLRDGLRAFVFDGPVQVAGAAGPAFVI